MTATWKKINDRLYENDPAEGSQKYELHQLPGQLILELEDFQFRETFKFSEQSRNSEKILLEEENVFLDKEIPIHQERINCIGRLEKNHRIELINSKKSFFYIKIGIGNYQRKAICGHINFKEDNDVYLEIGISPDQFKLLSEAASNEKHIASLVVKIPTFRCPVERAFAEDYVSYYLEENSFHEAEIISFHFHTENQSKEIIALQKNINKEKEEFLSLIRIRMFPKQEEEKSPQNTSSLRNSANSKIFWQHQDALDFFKEYKKIDTHFIPDFITVSIVSDLVLKYLDNPKLNDPYIDWIFLNFFVYQELAQFALIIKQKRRKFLGFIKNKDYFSSIKLWLKMRDFYELLKPPILAPNFIKLKLIECYELGARWGEQDNVSPLVYKIAKSNPEYMLVKPL